MARRNYAAYRKTPARRRSATGVHRPSRGRARGAGNAGAFNSEVRIADLFAEYRVGSLILNQSETAPKREGERRAADLLAHAPALAGGLWRTHVYQPERIVWGHFHPPILPGGQRIDADVRGVDHRDPSRIKGA